MSDSKRYPVPGDLAKRAHINHEDYQALYRRSIEDPEAFWAEQADRFLDWSRRWDRVSDNDLEKAQIRWFEGGKLNACYNCVDRHLDTRGDQTAILWEGDDPDDDAALTYRDLHARVCRFANALKAYGVGKGDRVAIYMPMIPEAAIAMLACARIGAIHSVVFGGFSPASLTDRILDSDCRTVITADEGVRGNKHIPLKHNVDESLEDCPNVSTVFVVRRTGGNIDWAEGRDVWYHEAVADQPAACEPETMDAEDPLYILYTSGSTGKPKGVLHTTGGYLLYCAMTHKYVFDYHDGDVYWCTADVGWVTGHSYIVYGPLANGATTLMFEGVPSYPDASRHWQVVDKHGVNIFYTSPTALRAQMVHGDEPVKRTRRDSLRVLGTVGEPINPDVWEWYHNVVGDGRCPVIDTWWQTETGGIMITPLAGATELKPGSATLPFFGVEPALLDDDGNEIRGEGGGYLVMKRPWPGQMRTVYGDHERFFNTYFKQHPGYYTSGDGATRDADGYYWVTGRVDDVINVSGHRLGTAEVENALVEHDDVAEAAVVGFPHEIKGHGIYAYITVMAGVDADEALKDELVQTVRRVIGPIAKPDLIQWAPNLPKTRSGKIMRRILRQIAAGNTDDLGDISTLADPSAVDELIENRQALPEQQ